VPVEIEKTELNRDFLYHLAGLQRVAIEDFDGIMRALEKIGVARVSTRSQEQRAEARATPPDERKSLMILPFEDLSPMADNEWFADGIVNELVTVLSNVKALRVIDQQTTKEYKNFKGRLATYAREMSIRYFVQGDVRKFADQIKISCKLLDIETGDHLWQDSMKGTMNDVFDIQEQVAEKVVDGLKVHLASDEKKKLAERGTENAEAYELYLKSNEYYLRQTREGYLLSLQQLKLAIQLDPNYADALLYKAGVLAVLYRDYDRDPNLLTEGERLAKRALEIKPDRWAVYSALSNIYRLQSRLDEAEKSAKEYVRRKPENYHSHFCLGLFYAETGQHPLAIPAYEKSIELKREQKPDDLVSYFNLVLSSDRIHDAARVERWSSQALPLYERRLRLVPDDENARVNYAGLLGFAGEPELALEALAPLLDKQNLDSSSLYNIACLYARMNDTVHALKELRRSVAAGFRNVEVFRTDPDLDSLRGIVEFELILSELSEPL
jgi:adenylate cyclase